MEALLKIVGVSVLGGCLLCGCIFRSFEAENEKNARTERSRNQTLAKAALVLDGAQEWSAKHGGVLPNAVQFRSEVGPFVEGKAGKDVSAAEVKDAFGRFQWTFAGGRVSGLASEVEVGHLSEANGNAIGYADGSVRRWRPIPPPK